MLISISFIIGMILAGGLVALMADKLGRTLGKKRLTLFGLRPRHTATMITVIAGMLIPFITVLLVAALSEDVREWIIKGRQAIDDSKRLNQTNERLSKNIDRLDRLSKEKTRDNQRLEVEVRDKTKTLQAKLQELRNVSANVQKLKGSVATLTLQTARLNVDLRTAKADLQQKKVDLARADKNLIVETNNLNALTARYNTLKTSYEVVDKQRQEANDEVEKLSQESDQLTQANSDLRAQNDRAQADLKKTKSDLEYAKLNLDSARAELGIAKAQQDYILRYMDTNVARTFFTPLTFGIGDELSRVTVPAHTDATTARGLFNNLMKDAVQVALLNGAKPNKQNDAATLFPKPSQDNQKLTPEQFEEAIILGVTNQPDDAMLIAKCELNSYLGDAVPVDVQRQPNPTVYHRNDKVAETMINGSAPEDVIFQKVSDFLTATIKSTAVKDGMIPVAGQEKSFGEIPIWQLVELSHSIKDAARPVRLTAMVDADTRAADPLRLHFRVR